MLLTLPFITLFFSFVAAQQYAGQSISLPRLPPNIAGGELAFFNIKDENGGNLTMANYFSLPNWRRQDTQKVQRAVIYIHGSPEDPQTYFAALLSGLEKATMQNPEVNQDSVALMAPLFPSDNSDWSRSDLATFKDLGWYIGETSVYPAGQKVSSFDVLEQITQYFSDASIYPNMKEIVIAGHSMGAQMVQRYVAVGKELFSHVPITYWIANPSTLLWLNDKRPNDTSSCPNYNDWGHGLDNYYLDYEHTFVNTLGNLGAVRLRYQRKRIAYARGLNDFGNYIINGECSPCTTGSNRGERLYNFFDAFPPDVGDTVDYIEGIGHNGIEMAQAPASLNRLFFDNFNGHGSRHASTGERGPSHRPGQAATCP